VSKPIAERYKITIISILVFISFLLIFYFHYVLHTGAVFTHFFYIPIILAAIWWKRNGIIVALILSLSLALSNMVFHEYFSTADDYLRVFMFLAISVVVAYLSERADRIRVRLHHLNLVLGAIRDINHLITKETADRDRLLRGICAILVKNRSYFYAWIALFDDSSRLISAAEAGLDGDFQLMAEMLKHGSLPLCVKRATNSRGVVLTRDPGIECAGCPMSGRSAGSRMTVSMSYGGRFRGILGVSMTEDLLDDNDEQVLFKEIAADIEFALSGIELRGEHEVALEHLKESEERFRTIVEHAPFGYYRVDRRGVFQYVNEEWERILGFSRGDVIGRHFSINRTAREAMEQKDLLARVLTGESVRGELGMIRKDGSTAYQTYNIQPVFHHGSIVGAEGFLNDITERKSAERARERTQRMLSQIIEGSPIPTFVIDENHVITHWNRACEILTGYSSEEMIGTSRQWEPFYTHDRLSLADMIMYNAQNPELARDYKGEYRKSPVLEEAADSERFFPHLEGRWLFFTAALLRDSERNIIGAVETLQDITERKRAEEERIRAFIELEQIFNSTPVGMRVIDRQFKAIHVNRRFSEMFGLDPSPSGDGVEDRLPAVIVRSDRMLMNRILKGERYVEHEVKIRVNDEDVICIVHASPYMSNEGTIIGIIENYTNITEMRNLQDGVMRIAGLERQRIGQDLHDGLGQNLTAVTFLIEAMKEKMSGMLSNEGGEIEHIESLIRDAIVQTRSLSRMLSPVEMEKNGLRSALDEMAAATEKVYHVSCQISQEGNFLINDNQTATHLYYIAREAVTNSIKHGKAERIAIRLIADDEGLAMIISDNGTGAFKEKKDAGLGLRIMRYRAAVIGADFNAGNRESGGFEVRVLFRAASMWAGSGKPPAAEART
jgi:PAS domain S-box-containing protein